MTVDTHSPVSIINRQTADIIVKSVPSALILDEQDCPIDTVHVDYNQRRIELFGILVVDVLSLIWNLKSAKLLVSDNRTCYLLDLYLQFQLGVRTMQVGPSSPLVGIISETQQSDKSDFWRSDYEKEFGHVFWRLGRAKNQQVFSTFKPSFVPIQKRAPCSSTCWQEGSSRNPLTCSGGALCKIQ